MDYVTIKLYLLHTNITNKRKVMNMEKRIVKAVNEISEFLALRQLKEVSEETLYQKYHIKKVDVLMVLGSDLPDIVRIGSEMYHKGLCQYLMFCGGIGHSTERLKKKVSEILEIDMEQLPASEAEIYAELAIKKYEIPEEKIVLEKKSTNTSENIKFALEILQEKGIPYQSILLLQDPILQYRSYVSAQEYITEETVLISYAPLVPEITEEDKILPEYPYLWTKERFFELILGEIWRLRDDENGYGPNGAGYFGHVDIPDDIEADYEMISKELKEYDKRCGK